MFVGANQAAIRAGLVATTFGIAQAKGFVIITNVTGGLAQGILAFVVPGALVLQLRKDTLRPTEEAAIKCLIAFGFAAAAITTYLALVSA